MPLLIRDDGVQFALRCYRELLTLKKKALFKKEALLLSQNNGNFARLFRVGDEQIEAVFSKDTGYLLGESVWVHLGRPRNLIFCEALPKTNQYITVLVLAGNVYLDAKLSAAELQDELRIFLTSRQNFKVVTYGEVPLAMNAEQNKVILDHNQISSVTVLEQSLLDELPANPDLQLLSIEQAIAELKLGRPTPAMIALTIAAALIIGYMMWLSSAPAPQATAQQEIDPRQAYRMELMTASPAMQLQAISNLLIKLVILPAWVATTIHYDGTTAVVEAHTYGGTTKELLAWSKAEGAGLNLSANGANLSWNFNLAQRHSIPPFVNMQENLTQLIDNVLAVLPEKSLAFGQTINKVGYRATAITIRLNQASPDVLLLLAVALQHLPLNMTSLDAKLDQGLLTGSLQMTLLGI